MSQCFEEWGLKNQRVVCYTMVRVVFCAWPQIDYSNLASGKLSFESTFNLSSDNVRLTELCGGTLDKVLDVLKTISHCWTLA